jgi:FixJ family two-component response regulator
VICYRLAVSSTVPFIAIVDDEEAVRKALMRLMRSAGLEAVMFSSGAEFLESLVTRRPDCVVLDLHMPGMSGFEVQARLAESGDALPVIIITAHDSTEARERALAAHARAYFRKPLDDRALLDAIAAAVSPKPVNHAG